MQRERRPELDHNVTASLAEVNPPLAKSIASLEAAIDAQRKSLVANAAQVADLAVRQSAIESLQTDLSDLASRNLDDIGASELDAILQRYAGVVDPGTGAALVQLVADLKEERRRSPSRAHPSRRDVRSPRRRRRRAGHPGRGRRRLRAYRSRELHDGRRGGGGQ